MVKKELCVVPIYKNGGDMVLTPLGPIHCRSISNTYEYFKKVLLLNYKTSNPALE